MTKQRVDVARCDAWEPHKAHVETADYFTGDIVTYVACDGKGYGVDGWPMLECNIDVEHSPHQVNAPGAYVIVGWCLGR